jgi:hypothetical protein
MTGMGHGETNSDIHVESALPQVAETAIAEDIDDAYKAARSTAHKTRSLIACENDRGARSVTKGRCLNQTETPENEEAVRDLGRTAFSSQCRPIAGSLSPQARQFLRAWPS